MDCVCATLTLLIRSLAGVLTMPARRSQPTHAAAGVLCGLGLVMRPNALRIIFGLLLGVLAALVIGALPIMGPPKAMEQSSFALGFSSALSGFTH